MVSTTYVYRHYDKDGCLLYIGIAENVQNRTKQHINASSWGGLISKTVVREYGTRIKAAIAELQAIDKEKPLHNVMPGKERRRKIENAIMFSVRVPETLLYALDKTCNSRKLSRSDYVRLILERELVK